MFFPQAFRQPDSLRVYVYIFYSENLLSHFRGIQTFFFLEIFITFKQGKKFLKNLKAHIILLSTYHDIFC